MTVKELIEALEMYDDDDDVVIGAGMDLYSVGEIDESVQGVVELWPGEKWG